jgi:hypothetical protein
MRPLALAAALIAAPALAQPSLGRVSPLMDVAHASDFKPTIVLEKPPCGTPEAAREKDNACQQWVVRRQPADEWPPYETPSAWLIPLPKDAPICAATVNTWTTCTRQAPMVLPSAGDQ